MGEGAAVLSPTTFTPGDFFFPLGRRSLLPAPILLPTKFSAHENGVVDS